MTLTEIKEFVASVDRSARHYESKSASDAYTVWQELFRLNRYADDHRVEAWAFYIHRYTPIKAVDTDTIPQAYLDALEADMRINYRHVVDYDEDTKYIHHIFECEG